MCTRDGARAGAARVAPRRAGGDVREGGGSPRPRAPRRTSPGPAPVSALARALAEHDAAVTAMVAACHRVPDDRWHTPPSAEGWSPAAVAVHVGDAYAFGSRAVAAGDTMRMLASPLMAWLGRTVLLPAMLATGRFPRGARAPREVRPDLAFAASLDRATALVRLEALARGCATALGDAPDTVRIRHAYFGDLPPRTALRMLAAHTMHHARLLDAAMRPA